MFRSVFRRLALVGLASLAVPISVIAQTRPEIIQGRVTSDSGVPLEGANVYATMAPNRDVFQATTGLSGRYRIEIPNGTGDYLVHISALGRRAYRKRVTREAGNVVNDTFTVDAVLELEVTELAAVRVQTTRPRPTRSSDIAAETGASERSVEGVVGAVSPDLAGDLDALASTIPGVTLTPGGISVLGLDPGQNRTTLNGMSFAGAAIPRDIRTRTRVYAGTYDPARGGFSGAQLDVELGPGSTFTSRRVRFSVDAPQLQARDPLASPLAQRFSRLDASLTTDGTLAEGRWHHNLGAQFKRQTSDVITVLNAGPDALRVAGIAPDSAVRLLALLDAAGIPLSAPGIPSDRVTDELILTGRLDRDFYKPYTFIANDRTWNLTGYGRLARSQAFNLSPFATPGRGGEQQAGTLMVQGAHSLYFGPAKEWLHDLRSAVTVSSDRSTPYLRLPDGRVLVSSLLDDGSLTSSTLTFGGNTSIEATTRSWTWETVSETQLYPPGQTRHRLKLHAQSRFDRGEQTFANDASGIFQYNSLEDLALNRPASFTRTLGPLEREGGGWSGTLALGDLYRRSRSFQLLYGVRAEANVFTRRPAHNPAIESEFGVRNDFVPNRFHLSPRLGFTWAVGRGSTGGDRYRISNIATSYIPSRGVIRGGIGEFRNLMSPMLIADAAVNTGLPTGARRIHCVGDATPVPEWRSYAAGSAVPESCTDGSPAFADAAPFVRLFDRNFDPPRSWRANISWTAATLDDKLDYTVEAVYSVNLDQPGIRDLNFAGQPRFTLPDERARPVFVSPASIVPATGVVAASEARQSAAFGRVLSQHAGLRSTSRQLTLTVTPSLPFQYFVRGAYTYGRSRALASGFDAAAFGDPREREWARSNFDTRHQLQLQLGMVNRWFSVTSFTRLSSGLPYTPVVRGDVNGDGVGGDRAFLFGLATTSTRDPARGLRELLARSDGSVRDCLTRQLGSIAGRNSCEGPWFATMNAQIAPSPRLLRELLGTNRAAVSINLSNPLAGLDQLLHGRNVRGWGWPKIPDPVLYTVRGFDPQTSRFQYEVNQRFGSTIPSRTLARAPFRITIDIRMDIGRPWGEQQLDRWLKPGRAGDPRPRLSVDSLKTRYARNLPDLYQRILQLSDSLLLSREQVTALQEAQRQFRTRLDSVWLNLATHMANLPDRYDSRAELDRQETTIDAAYEMTRVEAQARLPLILNPIQLRLLPYPAGMFYRTRTPFGPLNRVRIYMG